MSDGKSVRESLEDSFTARSHDENFERALGRLMVAWADAEREAYHVLVAYSGVSDAVGRALFSGTRMTGVIDFIRSIDFNKPLPIDRSADLAHVFDQISAINGIRNHLVHHSSHSYSFDENSHRVVANERTSRYGQGKGYVVSPEEIENITQDLLAISNHLNMHHGPRNGQFMPWRENSPSDPPTPWLYKPLKSIDTWEKSPAGARTSPLQPSTSQKKSQAQKAGI